jgi:hypothetical protein
MTDHMGERAREILSERSAAAYQFDWDIQVISLVAAEKAIISAREEALREAAERLLALGVNKRGSAFTALHEGRLAILSLIPGDPS